MNPRYLRLFLPAFLFFRVLAVQAQEATQQCPDGRTLQIIAQSDKLRTESLPPGYVQHLRYTISSTKGVKAVWIEVWDRPKRLSRTVVPVKTEGEVPCDGCNAAEETPQELNLAVFDAALPIDCYENCSGFPRGVYVSEVLAGKKPVEGSDSNTFPDYLLEDPHLAGPPLRFVEGSGTTDAILYGKYFIPTTRIYLTDGKDAWQKGDDSLSYLPSKTLDLRLIRVTIPKEFLTAPGVLEASALDVWEKDKAGLYPSKRSHAPELKIIVVGKNSPTLDAIEPESLPADAADPAEDKKVAIVLHGSGFTKDSDVALGSEPTSMSSFMADVTFVSPSELRAQIPASALKNAKYVPLKISVVNDHLHFSAPRELSVLPATKLNPAPIPALIRSITPYPVPMMEYHSPEFLELEINGDNFRLNDVVAYRYTYFDRTKLRTHYVSPHQLKAWLPRDAWRKHRLSFRLVVQSATGTCSAEAFANSLE